MKRISRIDLRNLEKELEGLEDQVIYFHSQNNPDLISLAWIESRISVIKRQLDYEEKKADFEEKGLSILS